jgi:hypothetical protein
MRAFLGRLCAASAVSLWVLSTGVVRAQEPASTPALTVTGTRLQWTAVENATGYDVIRGDVRLLRESADGFTAAVRVCLADDLESTQLDYLGVPKPGEAFFFLVRAGTGGIAGTFDSGGAGQSAPRDAAIDGATKSCFSTVTPHAPIVIAGDNQFREQRGVVRGSGTPGDPYLVAGWDITCDTPTNSTGVEIRNTTVAYTVRNVRVRSCETGILLEGTQDGRVERSRLEVDGAGVRVSGGIQMALDGNVLDGIAGTAIRLEAGSSALVQRNVVTGSGVGIDLDGAVSTVVRGNNLLGNAIQALDQNGASNMWNWSYPEGGNHWSDYAGTDQCSGVNQNVCAGGQSDGFGDQPVTLPSIGTDAYPLMAPASDEGDTLRPIIQWSPPSARFTPSVDITGRSLDSGTGIQATFVRVNGGAWINAGPSTDWSYHATLVPDANLIEAQAFDRAGNASSLRRATVTYYMTAPAVWQTVLQTPQASYAPGAEVPMTLRVTNTSAWASTLVFPSSCEASFTVTDEAGHRLYDWLQHIGCYTVIVTRNVLPGGTITYTYFTWDQIDDAGNRVAFPASYTLNATVDSDQSVPDASATISIEP